MLIVASKSILLLDDSPSVEYGLARDTSWVALLQQHPDIVINEIGTNNALCGLQLKDTEDNLRSRINAAHNAMAKVLLVGMRIRQNYAQRLHCKILFSVWHIGKENQSVAGFLPASRTYWTRPRCSSLIASIRMSRHIRSS